MSRKTSDDLTFVEEMARMGVARLDGSREQAARSRPNIQPPAHSPRAPGPSPKALSKGLGRTTGQASSKLTDKSLSSALSKVRGNGTGKRHEPSQPQGSMPAHGPMRPPQPASQPTRPDSGTGPGSPMMAVLTAELAQVAGELGQAEAELGQTRAELAILQAELKRAQAAGRAHEDERRTWDKERARLADRERCLRQELARAQSNITPSKSLRSLLEERGLVTDDEITMALLRLLEQRPRELIDAIELAAPEALVQFLEQRLVLLDEGMDGSAYQGCAVVRVPPERCEVTGGSDIKAAFRHFVEATRDFRLRQLTIVGGSIAYRKQLKVLSEHHGGRPKLNLVSGTQRRTRRQAESDERTSDLVVIWGATELNHSVSAVYKGVQAPLVRIPHRGISRMLEQLADTIVERHIGRA